METNCFYIYIYANNFVCLGCSKASCKLKYINNPLRFSLFSSKKLLFAAFKVYFCYKFSYPLKKIGGFIPIY